MADISKLCCEVYDDNQNNNFSLKKFENEEKELAYLIMQQRYKNLCSFLDIQQKKYTLALADQNELKKLWFIYNDLGELHFIGTDIYSDAMFIKHQVPYLYRSVGKDNQNNRVLEDKAEYSEIGKTLFKECLAQIKSGGQGKLFSYSKCFGKMLFKYANIEYGMKNTVVIEIREKPWVNSICRQSEDGWKYDSIQGFIREAMERGGDVDIPLFAIDMSNAREDKVANLKIWFDDYIGEQSYIRRYNDIYDPVGDAEVVSNFTGNACNGNTSVLCSGVKRYELNLEEFCTVLYKYAKEFATRSNINGFDRFIERTIATIGDKQNPYYTLYDSILNGTTSNVDGMKIADIFQSIEWEKEQYYMSRVKEEKKESDGNIPQIDIFKENTSEPKSRIWKEIILEAIRGVYSYMNGSNLT